MAARIRVIPSPDARTAWTDRPAIPMPDSVHHADLCGWHVQSDLALPELARWRGPEGPAEITIAFGKVPERLGPLRLETPAVQIDAAGRARFSAAGVASFLIEGGNRCTIAAEIDRDAPDIRLFLLGTAFGVLCHQRGVLPIHAATVEIDGEAVLLAGPSGAGKSTLAAGFLRRGFRILGDDVAPLSFESGKVVVRPGLRRLRLWADSIAALDWRTDGMERCRQGLEKFSRTLDEGPAAEPLAPRAVVHLHVKTGDAEATFERLKGRRAFESLRREIYRRRSLVALAGENADLRRALEATGGIPQHYVFARAHQYQDLDVGVDMIVETVRSGR